jgi:two-component system chemotaxis response regulator CheB
MGDAVGPLRVAPNKTAVAVAPDASVPAFDVVVIGASAGGLPALATLLREIPVTFPVPVALVLHLSPDRPSVLTDVLARYTGLRVRWAENGSRLARGTIHVAPPDRHVMLQADGAVLLLQTPPVRFSRPSVDVLFDSAARAFGRRTLAVILTGNGHDGSDGVRVVHECGGVVIAQDEASSQYFSMPREAIESGGVSFVLPLASIGAAVRRLVALGIDAGVEGAPPATR